MHPRRRERDTAAVAVVLTSDLDRTSTVDDTGTFLAAVRGTTDRWPALVVETVAGRRVPVRP